jgi:RasGEF domain
MSGDFNASTGVRNGELLAYTPEQIGAALTVLEARMYNLVRPADYIIHLSQDRSSSRVAAACAMTDKIAFWVKRKVLNHSTIDGRVELIKFFIETAHVSSSNFSDLII